MSLMNFNDDVVARALISVKANNVDQVYCDLLRDIRSNGTPKNDRTGTGTTSVFGRQIRFDMGDGFPLLTSKKMYTKGVIIELLWFLGKHMSDAKYNKLGRTNIRYLLDNECMIWVGDAYKRYLKDCDLVTCDVDDWEYTAPKSGAPRHCTRAEFISRVKTDDGFANRWGDLGPIYGAQWCDWGGSGKHYAAMEVLCELVDSLDELQDTLLQESTCTVQKAQGMVSEGPSGYNQIAKLIEELKRDPDSRRLMVTAWNPTDLEASVLPPCHYGFQCYTTPLSRVQILKSAPKEVYEAINTLYLAGGDMGELIRAAKLPTRKLNLMWNQRSVDVCLGLPFNIASYAFLLHMLAAEVGMVPGELIGSLGDCHVYNDQWEGVQKQLANETYPLPTLTLQAKSKGSYINEYTLDHFQISNYESAGVVHYSLSN